jgi:hypothetical protein
MIGYYVLFSFVEHLSKVAFHLQVPDEALGPMSYHIAKALLTSRKMLLEELKKISDAIGKRIEDLDAADLNLGKYEPVNPSNSGLPNSSKVFPATGKGVGQLAGILHDFLEVCFIFFLCLTILELWIQNVLCWASAETQ